MKCKCLPIFEDLGASSVLALGELVITHNFRSNVIPAQAGIQALRPYSLGTRLRGYDGCRVRVIGVS